MCRGAEREALEEGERQGEEDAEDRDGPLVGRDAKGVEDEVAVREGEPEHTAEDERGEGDPGESSKRAGDGTRREH